MMITLTKSALHQLKSMELNDEQLPRIDADIAGGCGLTVTFSLVFDEERRNDSVFEYDGIQIRIDHFTKRYLNEETQIDYTDERGFLVGESYESSACALEIN